MQWDQFGSQVTFNWFFILLSFCIGLYQMEHFGVEPEPDMTGWTRQNRTYKLFFRIKHNVTLLLSSMLALAENLLWEGRSQWKRLGAPLRPGFSSVDISRLIWHVFLYCRHFSLTELGWGTPEDWLESRQLLMRQVKPQEVSQICNIRIQVLHMLSTVSETPLKRTASVARL